MAKFRVTARHTPLPRKTLVVLAESAEQAVEAFLAANHLAIKTRKRSGPKLAELVGRWEAEGGQEDLAVAEVDESVKPDVDPEGHPVTAETALESRPKKRPYNRRPKPETAPAGVSDEEELPAGLTGL